jgi:hypothetical protein
MTGEIILRGLALVLFSPVIIAAVAYAIGHPSIALLLNALVPLLVFLGSGLAMLNNPTRVTAAGVLYFVVPLVVLLACAAGLRVRTLQRGVFWFTWAANVAILAFLFYLSFFFKVF